MSVWRSTKANAARRTEAVIIHRIMKLILDRVVAEMHRIFAEFEARTPLVALDIAGEGRLESWPWSAYAEPPQ